MNFGTIEQKWRAWSILIIIVIFLAPSLTYASILARYYNRILPNTYVSDLNIGDLTPAVAEAKLSSRLESLRDPGIFVRLRGDEADHSERVSIPIKADVKLLVAEAYARGRSGIVSGSVERAASVFGQKKKITPSFEIEPELIKINLINIARLVDTPVKDIRLKISSGRVDILEDTKPGRVLNQARLLKELVAQASELRVEPVEAIFVLQEPNIELSSVEAAKLEAEKIISKSLNLQDRGETYKADAEKIGSWLVNESLNGKLEVGIDRAAVSVFVANLATAVNQPATDLGVEVEDGKVVKFIPPKPGRVIEEDKTIEAIIAQLEKRRQGEEISNTIILPTIIREASVVGNAAELGINELIGRATTTFTGSPKNRISNIKNGVKLLSGIIVKPGEEFSTIGALGQIDNTTGYLPELVIRGNRTVPEFGGGLCQVSTTLFRSVLNTGLPIVERQNHSYRVIYYEKDGEGKFIGPGLDATIYDPKPDFKFLNDTASSILITGYVIGDRLTFELYGTKDGRSSSIDGPRLLTSVPAGEPIYIETDEIEPGVTKQIEKPHPGGTATAGYVITYADGTKKEYKFNSSYRPWPAQYLVGVEPTISENTDEVSESSSVPVQN